MLPSSSASNTPNSQQSRHTRDNMNDLSGAFGGYMAFNSVLGNCADQPRLSYLGLEPEMYPNDQQFAHTDTTAPTYSGESPMHNQSSTSYPRIINSRRKAPSPTPSSNVPHPRMGPSKVQKNTRSPKGKSAQLKRSALLADDLIKHAGANIYQQHSGAEESSTSHLTQAQDFALHDSQGDNSLFPYLYNQTQAVPPFFFAGSDSSAAMPVQVSHRTGFLGSGYHNHLHVPSLKRPISDSGIGASDSSSASYHRYQMGVVKAYSDYGPPATSSFTKGKSVSHVQQNKRAYAASMNACGSMTDTQHHTTRDAPLSGHTPSVTIMKEGVPRLSQSARTIMEEIVKDLLTQHLPPHVETACKEIQQMLKENKVGSLRDFEKFLLFKSTPPSHSIDAEQYSKFGIKVLYKIKEIYQKIPMEERTRPNGQDIAYTRGYFLDAINELSSNIAPLLRKRRAEDGIGPDGDLPLELNYSTQSHGASASLPSQPKTKGRPRTQDKTQKSFKCEFTPCGQSFLRRCDLTKHGKTHTRPFKCGHTGCKYLIEGFPTEKERDRHFDDKHSDQCTMYKCQYSPCTYESKRESNLKQHMEKKHKYNYQRTKQPAKRQRIGQSTVGTPAQQVSTPSAEAFAMSGGNLSQSYDYNSIGYQQQPSPYMASPAGPHHLQQGFTDYLNDSLSYVPSNPPHRDENTPQMNQGNLLYSNNEFMSHSIDPTLLNGHPSQNFNFSDQWSSQ
ncbi:hypothetical protein DFH27DRAFT_298761 [Peziza echinospora]|nr:hypothetical protein DFH27DRAFT_298761 [Peziza echinospora]